MQSKSYREERQSLATLKVEELWQAVHSSLEPAELYYPTPCWSNVQFSPGYGLLPVLEPRVSVAKQSIKFIKVLEVVREMVLCGGRTTKRDIFYQNFSYFGSQREVDSIINVLVSMLQVPRLYLGVVATSKGLVVGDLSFLNSEEITVDCNLAVGGLNIPQDVPELANLHSEAKLVLVIEKDAIFQRLLDEGILSGRLPSLIMITGKGVPDLATRQLVYRLATELLLPVMLLTDCDPYGMDIGLMYKFGSLAMSWCAESLAVPSSVWLGLLPSDVRLFGIGKQSTKPFSPEDWKKVVDISKREYVAGMDEFQEELDTIWTNGRKAEIQQVAEERGTGFLADTFIPAKIAHANWI